MTVFIPLNCSECPRTVGQFVRRADGTVGLVLIMRHDRGDNKHITFWTAEQLRQMLAELEHEPVDKT